MHNSSEDFCSLGVRIRAFVPLGSELGPLIQNDHNSHRHFH